MNMISRKRIFYFALLIAVVFSLIGLVSRYSAEKNNTTVGFVAEYKDIVSLALQEGKSEEYIWDKLKSEGISGLTISEYTGEELIFQDPLRLKYGSAKELGLSVGEINPSRATVMISNDVDFTEILIKYIEKKLPMTELLSKDSNTYLLLPGTVEEFRASSFLPDLPGLEFCKRNDVTVLYRPGTNTLATGRDVAKSIDFITDVYPQIKNILPAGAVISGYPDLNPLASLIKNKGLSLSQAEFIKQIGVAQLASRVPQNVLPLHSLTKEEIFSKRFQRTTILERYVRAIQERSIRLIILRPYDLKMGDRLDSLTGDIKAMKSVLTTKGYSLGWPKTLPYWPIAKSSAFACAIIIVFSAWIYLARLINKEGIKPNFNEIITLLVSVLFFSLVLYKYNFAAKLLGGFCGAFIATEATFTALESFKKPFFGAIASLFIVISGGLAIASFYGTVPAILRLTPFSGVKITLLLPPLLVILHDFIRRIHPEPFAAIVKRSAIWGELLLMGMMFLALLVIMLRSDNVSNVPALEIAFRTFIEKVLQIRPRTKEFMIGYPALVFYWYLRRNDYLAKYREAVRVITTLAFCSAINTFCHFHTFIKISLIRVINGWWLGLFLGTIFVLSIKYIALPLFKKLREYMPVG